MTFEWTEEQRELLRRQIKWARRNEVDTATAVVRWFDREVLPNIKARYATKFELKKMDVGNRHFHAGRESGEKYGAALERAKNRKVAEWLLAEQEWRHRVELKDAFAQGQNDNEEWLEAAYQRGRAAARREADADRARTVSTPKTRNAALGHAVALSVAKSDRREGKVVSIARDFDDYITGAEHQAAVVGTVIRTPWEPVTEAHQ